ncbi:AcvB/VirJ family lysyl-phosphatidylglycerol hydrolase [Immundisolibacter sp.]
MQPVSRAGYRGLQAMNPIEPSAPFSRAWPSCVHPAGRRLPGMLLLLLLLSQTACSAGPPAPVDLNSDDWGAYRVQPPAGSVARLAFVFGAATDPALDATVRALARHGALVARIDVDRFAANVLDRPERCLDLAGIVNWHADYLGRRFALADLDPPLLVGHGLGAGWVYALAAQAPPLTFAGAVTDAPASRLALHKPLCQVSGRPNRVGTVGLHALSITLPWRVVGDTSGATLLPAVEAKSPGRVQRVGNLPLAGVVTDTLDALEKAARPQAASVGDLPLVELPAKKPTGTLAIIYSGDGGWRDIDKTIGGLLSRQGVAVVGVDSVRYFWHHRQPQRIADDLARILDHYRTAWGSHRVVVIGYSFGADILPFAYNRLPAEWQQRVGTLALLAPGHGADFEVSISSWLGRKNPGAAPLLPELLRIPPGKVLCVYGAKEKTESLCTMPGAGSITRLERPGDHHFDRRYDQIADAIRAHLAAGKP